jgi:hypothetical protein
LTFCSHPSRTHFSCQQLIPKALFYTGIALLKHKRYTVQILWVPWEKFFFLLLNPVISSAFNGHH